MAILQQPGDMPAVAPTPEGIEISGRTVATGARRFVATAGDIVHFATESVRALPQVRHYASEVFRQCGILILSSSLIIWGMLFIVGSQIGVEAHYVMNQLGAPGYMGAFTAWAGLREMSTYMFGYILAAKVGCGLVAEIGSMRISEEIDAMEVMGIPSRPYLVGARIIAAWIAMPVLWIVGLFFLYLGEYLVVVVQLGGVSEGGYWLVFWLFQNPLDLLFAMLKALSIGTAIIFVACYFGFTASGGPVGVGQNTAKSMMLNMVLVHVIGLLVNQLLWGSAANAPVAN